MEEINVKEEIYKCSKCGLCQSVCPIFQATGNEKFLPRGRFNILNASKTISKQFIKDLDVCLNCNECQNFCPSNIDSCKIYTYLKNKYYNRIIPFSLKYKLILLYHSFIKNFSFDKLYKINFKKNASVSSYKIANVVYFQGCFNKYINPSDKNAALYILRKNGYNPISISGFCCGLPYLSDGDFKGFEKNSQKILNSIPKNVKYVVTSCDSCYNTLSEIFKNSQISLIRLSDLISNTKSAINAVFHKPYSLEKYSGNLNVINKKYSCSLMENYFMIKHKNLVPDLLNKIFYTKSEIEGKIIVTSCNLSKWGLTLACKNKKINADILSLAEYMNYS